MCVPLKTAVKNAEGSEEPFERRFVLEVVKIVPPTFNEIKS
jgi:hypothetical protein